MIIFETDRLIIRHLKEIDSIDYFDMMGNPNVMNSIPRTVMSKEESDQHLKDRIATNQDLSSTKVWAIEVKDGNEFIGLCAFVKNNDQEDEIGYRLREKFWRQGFATEMTKALISYGFDVLKMEKITADVDTKNIYSDKILNKFMSPKKEFFNAVDNTFDKRYEVLKCNWNPKQA